MGLTAGYIDEELTNNMQLIVKDPERTTETEG